jgi:sulfur-oxidizing protein SoxX
MAGFAQFPPKSSADWCRTVVLAGFAVLLPNGDAGEAAAGTPALVPYQIVGDAIPQPLTGGPGDPARGRAIVVDRHAGLCLLCHSGPFPEERLQGNLAPNLAGIGTRLAAGQLRLRIVDASRVNPETIMPPYYRIEGLERVAPAYAGKPILSAEQIEDVVAFLATLGK